MLFRTSSLLIIFLLFPIKLLVANSDSVTTVINNTRGVERIDARLNYAQSIAKTDLTGALIQAETALEEARGSDDQRLVATVLFRLSQVHLEGKDRDSAEKYLHLAQPIAKVQNEYGLNSRIQIELGKIYQYRGNNSRALEYFNEAVENAERIDNYRLLGACYSSIGNIYRMLGAYDKALEYIIRAKSNYQLANFEEGAAWTAYTLGRLNRDLGIYDEAKASFKESLIIYTAQAKASGDSIGVALCLDQLGLINLEQNKPHSAKLYFQRSLIIYTLEKSQYGISNAWIYQGRAEYALGNYSEAKALLQKSLNHKRQTQDALGIPGIYRLMGLVLIADDQWQAGIDSLMIGLEKATRNKQRHVQYDIYGQLAKANENTGNLSEALKYYKFQFNLQDSIISNPVRFKLPELRGIYELEQNRQKIKNLNQTNRIIGLELTRQRTIQWGLIIGGIFLAIFSGLIYKQYRNIRTINTENEILIKKLHQETQRRVLVEKELAESDNLKELLLDIITHDLRNPAASIFSFSEIAQKSLPGNKIIDLIHSSSERLIKVLESTTVLTHATFGEKVPKVELNLFDCVAEVVDDLRISIQTSRMELELDIPKRLKVLANPLIAEIFKNYISNATKYARDGKKIIIEAAKENESVIISVKDFGKTIPEEDRMHVFERNVQLTKENKQGRGLGLAIVKRIAIAHGGEAWVEPNKPKGNSFCLRIPR